MAQSASAIISVEKVTKSFPGTGNAQNILAGISFELREGEIVALLGKSGSGKSTLLRIMAGLIAPTTGEVRAAGEPLRGANSSASMVFQSFALMPWLTIQANVELGLEARGVPRAERQRRALEAIDLIGLDGFESAYPKELSGGMRQRVGFARALVTEPDALLMDEPFSALDVLTAENLRAELTALWGKQDFPTKSICIVTHNIEEAVLLADRVVVLGGGELKADLPITLARPRDRKSAAFEALVDQLYGVLASEQSAGRSRSMTKTAPASVLPNASVGGLSGLVDILEGHDGKSELSALASELLFEVDDLLPLVDAGAMLDLLKVSEADVALTAAGRRWANADIQDRKQMFARLTLEHTPFILTICRTLATSNRGRIRDDFFLDLLRRGLSEDNAQRQLTIAIDWGRYAELFDYDADSGDLVLAEAYTEIGKSSE